MTSQIPHHITLRECGDLWIKAKANSISKQLAAIADHARLGTVPYQDCDPAMPNYNPRASYEVMK